MGMGWGWQFKFLSHGNPGVCVCVCLLVCLFVCPDCIYIVKTQLLFVCLFVRIVLKRWRNKKRTYN